ncbi:class I SAM-dependent methyltransferase [Candidatus Viridilinea mediisalina]|uniref:Methyltransferase type 11 domain-containing protein n=1 Tax=Candidatus Viridilinea mediisalina TaxID=2024553 RepID=A0A2A6RPP8_9CHLR|nr:class I SAM-dependent methyltransferase [Candidatus Viridilinea mediisalina]PDW04871.1 hypothetical protein CJ255_01295 [Candidatus Viridilinea mediisalina]
MICAFLVPLLCKKGVPGATPDGLASTISASDALAELVEASPSKPSGAAQSFFGLTKTCGSGFAVPAPPLDGIILSMIYRILGWLAGGLGVGALLYWQVILAEGAYFGRWAVRLIYRLGAKHYDALRQPWQAEADAILQTHMQAALGNHAYPHVLDVATGTGRVPLLLYGSANFNGVVVALDLTPAMLTTAQAKSAQLPILWLQAEAEALPAPNATFDLVTCLEALEYFPHPRHALAEMVRVLRPGGTLLLSKVPDSWARLLPGRAFQRMHLEQTLQAFGCHEVTFAAWQEGHYELVACLREPSYQ